MPYSQELTNRVRDALAGIANVEEKKMFSGVTFMVNGKMCISVAKDQLMCRVDPEISGALLKRPGCRPMIHGGRILKGYLYVDETGFKTKSDFDYWVKLSLDFNERAKASKKKKPVQDR